MTTPRPNVDWEPPSHDESATLREQIERHPATAAHRRWTSMRLMHTVLMTNEQSLLRFLGHAKENPPVVEDSERFWFGLYTPLHNYVASVKSLVDHTRNLLKDYQGTFPAEGKQRIGAFKDEPVVQFVHRLRNYFLHAGVPSLSYRLSMTKNDDGSQVLDCHVALEPARLLVWDDWNVASRKYLAALPESHELALTIVDYREVIETFYRWLYAQYTVLHRADNQAVNIMIARLQGPPELRAWALAQPGGNAPFVDLG